jgi:hypothetical protein
MLPCVYVSKRAKVMNKIGKKCVCVCVSSEWREKRQRQNASEEGREEN